MIGPIAKHRSWIITFIMATFGLAMITLANAFHYEWEKIELDRLVAEVGALVLVVGILHWFFEFFLRKEMLREVSVAVIGNTRLHDNGLVSCTMDSRQVQDREHWMHTASLTIGLQYSPKFFKDFHDTLRFRCASKLPTTVAVLRSDGTAAHYLTESKTGNAAVAECIREITALLVEAAKGGATTVRLMFHDRVLRYSFIRTDEFIWVKFFTNSPDRATVPAFKIRAETPLFEFFDSDIRRLLEQSRDTA